ncbi:MAG: type II secretion system protein [Thermomonas sp.]
MRQRGFSPALGHSPRAFTRPGGSAAKAAGFTLLEMIVVLAILGLATAMVVPSALRGIDTWRRQTEQDALLDQIRALPGNARATGRPVVISDETLALPSPPLKIAADWTLRTSATWRVHANGVCDGGEVEIGNAYGTRVIKVGSPFCDPVVQQ